MSAGALAIPVVSDSEALERLRRRRADTAGPLSIEIGQTFQTRRGALGARDRWMATEDARRAVESFIIAHDCGCHSIAFILTRRDARELAA